MNQRPAIMNVANMVHATSFAKRKVDSYLDLARQIEFDAFSEKRLAVQQCRACYYPQSIAGAAITVRPCMCCGTVVQYSSTNTDVLCMDCAKEHNLCKHCGGDIEMRAGRREWPEPKVSAAPQEGGT